MVGRNENGRFAKGNQASKKENGGNGGRSRRSVEARCLDHLSRVITDEDLDKLFLSGLSRAKAGDVTWAKLLLGYLIGLPIQRAELSGPDAGPLVIQMVWGDDNPGDYTTAATPGTEDGPT